MREIRFHDTTRTYATPDNLRKALAKMNLPENIRYVLAYTEHGRCTAIFTNALHFHYHLIVANKGFMVVG